MGITEVKIVTLQRKRMEMYNSQKLIINSDKLILLSLLAIILVGVARVASYPVAC